MLLADVLLRLGPVHDSVELAAAIKRHSQLDPPDVSPRCQ
jgi:hypothetical protein